VRFHSLQPPRESKKHIIACNNIRIEIKTIRIEMKTIRIEMKTVRIEMKTAATAFMVSRRERCRGG
jgi:hypothetical protein